MSEVAVLIADMVRAGVDPDLIGRTAAALSQRETVLVPDEAADRRRAKDAERKRLRRSAEIGGLEPPDKETSPTPPKEINPLGISPLKPPAGGRRRKVVQDEETYVEFEENVWTGFPRHPNSRKDPAFRAYANLAMEGRADCIRGVMRYAQRFRATPDPKRTDVERLNFVPHLVTWINQKGWEVELERTH